MMDRILLGGKGLLLRSLPSQGCSPGWSNSRAQHVGGRGEESAELVFGGGGGSDVTRAGERLRGCRGPWVGTSAAGRPGSPQEAHLRYTQEQMAKKERRNKDSRAAGGESDKEETTGSGSASCGAASKKPADRPMS